MPKTKVTFTIGQGFDKDGEKLYAVEAKRVVALAKTARLFGGFSASDVIGGWINGKDELVTEQSLVIAVFTTKEYDVVEEHAQWLAQFFNQEAVMVTVEPANTLEFVGQ